MSNFGAHFAVETIETKPCPVCGRTRTMTINPADVQRWKEGELIQKAMPYLTAEEREALISGVCSNRCWATMFSEEE